MVELRVIDTGLADPAYTAALDEALLRGVEEGSPPTLHLYRREPPGVTLGYFLEAGEHVHLEHCRDRGIKVIRRRSGGGAIYTDRGQIVYGLSARSLLPRAPVGCFEKVCGAVVRALSSLGCGCRYSPVNDVLAGGRKISGSALVNRGVTKLIHGTVIVTLDRHAMFSALRVDRGKLASKGCEAPGQLVTSLEECIGRRPSMNAVREAMTEALAEEMALTPVTGEPTGAERDMAHRLVRERYGRDDWNLRR